MAEQIAAGKVSRSVPSLPVTGNVPIKLFLDKTPIPSIQKEPTQWVQGAPTPIQEGQMTPNTEALNLLTGFATGQIIMKDDEVQHIPSISWHNLGNTQT